MNPDALTARILAALTDDLRRPPWRGNPNPTAGHCYIASEVLYHALGGPESGYTPHVLRVNGTTHWFLRHGDRILDPTADQFTTPIPYHTSRGIGFLTRNPSKRAQQLATQAGITLPNRP